MIKTVFVIDDDQISLFITQKIFERYRPEWRVITYTDAANALEVIQANLRQADQLPDLILLDLRMPGMDGWSFLQACNRIKHLSAKPIYCALCSSSVDPADFARAAELEAALYLAKPLSVQQLEELEAACRPQPFAIPA